MMDEMLQKRISDALLDEESPAIDDELQKEIDDDTEGAQYLQDITVLEQHLRQWGFEEPPKQYWKGFSKRMTPRLGGSAPPDEDDPLLPPAPDEPEEIRSLAALQPPEEEDELDGLAALAGRSTLPPASSFEDDPSASDDDENVLDIGALRAEAEKEEEEKAPAKPKSSDKDHLSAAAATPSASAARGEKAAAPSAAAAPQQQKSNSTMYAIIGALVLALCVVGYLAFFSGDGQNGDGQLAQASSVSAEPTTSGGSSPSSPAETPSGEPSGDEFSEGGEGIDDPAEEESESVEGGEEDAVEGSEEGAAEGDEESAGRARRVASRTSAARRSSSESGSSETSGRSSEAPTKSAPPAARSSSEEPTPSKGGAANDLDDLLAGATDRVKNKRGPSDSGNADAVQAAVGSGGSSGGSELPEQPSRSQVRRAMGSVAGQVMACRSLVESQTRVNATVTVASSGSVQNASVSGGSPQVQQCVQRAVRRARFPRFQRSTFSVTYPFILSPPE